MAGVDHVNREKPKVLMLLTNPFLPDPRVLKEARSLSQKYEVTIWALDPEGKYKHCEAVERIRVERTHLAFLRPVRSLMLKLRVTLLVDVALFYLRSWRLLLRKFKIVHSHDIMPLALALFLGKLKGARIVFDAHEDFAALVSCRRGRWIVRSLFRFERLLMRYVDAVIVVGDIMKEEYRERTSRPIHVVGNWSDPQEFRRPPERSIASRARNARRDGRLIVSYLAGIHPNRILLPLLEAAREDPEVFIIVAGGRRGDPVALAVEETMAGLSNGLYLGWVDRKELNAYIAYTDVVYYCLLPADPNNRYYVGNTISSALAAGKAVITTEIGELGRVVKAEGCGIVMPEASKEHVISAFAKLKERRYLRILQQNAARASRVYNWQKAERVLLALYEELEKTPFRQTGNV